MKNSEQPKVSILIPSLNEDKHIVDCIDSIINGNFPRYLLEIIVIDGGSTDDTVKLLSQHQLLNPEIRILHNQKKVVPAALNIGLKEANHSILVWLGAHAIYDKNYIKKSVSTLMQFNPASVGGVIQPVGLNWFGRAVAQATSTKFGIGNAKYRHATRIESVDTVFGGCWKKESVIKAGGFNENWVRNQDFEFNYRLRKKVGTILLDPSIKCSYFCRGTIKELAKQYFQYGYWRFHTTITYPKTFSVRQAAPLLLLISLCFSAFIYPINATLGLIIPCVYITSSLLVSIYISTIKKKASHFILLPIIFSTIHFSWATGFITSSTQHLIKNISLKFTTNNTPKT